MPTTDEDKYSQGERLETETPLKAHLLTDNSDFNGDFTGKTTEERPEPWMEHVLRPTAHFSHKESSVALDDEYYDPAPTDRALMREQNEFEEDNLTPRRNHFVTVDEMSSQGERNPDNLNYTRNNMTNEMSSQRNLFDNSRI